MACCGGAPPSSSSTWISRHGSWSSSPPAPPSAARKPPQQHKIAYPSLVFKVRRRPAIRAQLETQSKGLSYEDGGRWLSCTTRHIRIYAGYIDPVTLKMDQSQLDKLSLILDPDDEFVWPGDTPDKVFEKFKELVDNYAGAPLTEYTLRLIGSDLEHYIRKMLFANEIKYNLECRVLNFSMGKPRLNIEDDDEEAA